MKITRATQKAVNYACKKFHYAKSVPTVQYAYNIYNNSDEWCGVIIFGGGRTTISQRVLARMQEKCLNLKESH